MSEKRPDLGNHGFYADLEDGVSVTAGSESRFTEGLIANLKAEVARLTDELKDALKAHAADIRKYMDANIEAHQRGKEEGQNELLAWMENPANWPIVMHEIRKQFQARQLKREGE